MIQPPPCCRRRPARTRNSPLPVLAGAVLFAGLSGGCPSLEALPTQAPVQEMIEARTQRPYLLYIPSQYSRKRHWPLMVVCHGTWPYDTADQQMREWARFCENEGILLAAPSLKGAKGDLPPQPAEQIELQQQDERLVLGIVGEIRNRYNVADEQIFLTGWSAGAYTILHTGLRNPDVFRALAIRQGSFDEKYLDVPSDLLDPWQPILVLYGRTDFLKDQTRASIKWLRSQKMYVEEEEIPGTHRRIDPKIVWHFFAKIVKERPWIRIRIHPAEPPNPLAIRLDLRAIPSALRVRWRFGDGEESVEASPVHTYAAPGRYEIQAEVTVKGGKRFLRKRVLNIREASPPP